MPSWNCLIQKSSESHNFERIPEIPWQGFGKINPEYSNCLKLASTLTLVVEHLSSKMRSTNDMPTVLEFAHQLIPTVRESLFTTHRVSPTTSYQKPLTLINFEDLPSIPPPNSVKMTKEQQKVMRDWRDSFGTLPLYAYSIPEPLPQPVDFNSMIRPTEISENNVQATPRRPILFQAGTTVAIKLEHLKDISRNGPFCLGIVTSDVPKDDHNPHLEIELYVPSFQNCMEFNLQDVTTVHQDAIFTSLDGN